MRKIVVLIILLAWGGWWWQGGLTTVGAVEGQASLLMDIPPVVETSASAQAASASATPVNSSARLNLQERKDQDLTESTGAKTDDLVKYLAEKPIDKLAWNNWLQVGIRMAVERGVPPNLIALLILFPLVAAIIAGSRHVIGLRGFGIYTPAALSVALMSTGIRLGVVTFVVIVVILLGLQRLVKKVSLAHLPKTALIIWGVCVSMILFLIAVAYFNIKDFYTLTIFPLLLLISLSENFTSTQLFSTTKEATRLTLETLILAMISALLISNDALWRFVILNPELSLVGILLMDGLIGRYNGLRLMELWRFKALIKKE